MNWIIINTFPSQSLTAVLEKDATTIPELYHAVNALVSFGQKVPDAAAAKIVKTLQATLKKDDSPLKYVVLRDCEQIHITYLTSINNTHFYSLGYVFHIAADLGPAGAFAFNHIEDAIVQADEVDGRFLQFEGGLGVTSKFSYEYEEPFYEKIYLMMFINTFVLLQIH